MTVSEVPPTIPAPADAMVPSAPAVPRSKILAVGAFLATQVHKTADGVDKRIDGVYDRKMATAQPCEEERRIVAPVMGVAKTAHAATRGVSKVTGVAAKAIDGVAHVVGSRASPNPNSKKVQVMQVYVEVSDAVEDRAEGALNKVVDRHAAYTAHTSGPQSAELVKHVAGAVQHGVKGYSNAMAVRKAPKGLAKGIAKNAVLGRPHSA